jgi:phage terminase Nu1 subunit (DNA packaging protein)
MIVDRSELSRLFGISISRFMLLAREGILSRVSRGRYDVAQCLEQYIAYKLQGGQNGSPDVIAARKKLYDAQTHKTELENERARSETIPADIHLADMRAVQQIFDTALDDLDSTLADDIAGMNDATAVADRLRLATNATRQAVADNIVAYAATVEG